MSRLLLLAVCCVLTVEGSTFLATQKDRDHDQWLKERYWEATSIKEGMTRADLVKVFRIDGGLQRLLPTRYVLKRSSFIKVDVEFEVPSSGRIVPEDLGFEWRDSNEDIQFIPNDKLKIKRISAPYLEQFNYD
jgi:hypothetical protein